MYIYHIYIYIYIIYIHLHQVHTQMAGWGNDICKIPINCMYHSVDVSGHDVQTLPNWRRSVLLRLFYPHWHHDNVPILNWCVSVLIWLKQAAQSLMNK